MKQVTVERTSDREIVVASRRIIAPEICGHERRAEAFRKSGITQNPRAILTPKLISRTG
jgi:hypothetical protein